MPVEASNLKPSICFEGACSKGLSFRKKGNSAFVQMLKERQSQLESSHSYQFFDRKSWHSYKASLQALQHIF